MTGQAIQVSFGSNGTQIKSVIVVEKVFQIEVKRQWNIYEPVNGDKINKHLHNKFKLEMEYFVLFGGRGTSSTKQANHINLVWDSNMV